MTASPDQSQRINLGGPVVACEDIGGVWNPPIREGTIGWVIQRSADGRVLVEFDGHRSQLVEPVQVRPNVSRSAADGCRRGRLRRRHLRT
jgi:hypothetical protein